MTTRLINQDEITLVRQVFQDQLPYDKIHIADFYLPGNEGVAVTLISGAAIIPIRSLSSFTIYFGPNVFRDGANSSSIRNTFVHECTHVWQGYHSKLSWGYMVESMIAQGRAIVEHGDRNRAYDYELGKAWSSYNVEQQANIVEDWFAGGMRTDDERYTYIANNIRAGRA